MRPRPSEHLLEPSDEPMFVPAPELIDWARATFIEDEASLCNPDHRHLQVASLGALWTNVAYGRQGRRILGQCEHGLPPSGKWMRSRIEMQLLGWFGQVPDFLLTFDADYASTCSDVAFAALVEHELAHAGHERDQYGAPKFRKSGQPAFAIRAHDVEGFIGIAARYGAIEPGVKELLEALQSRPKFSAPDISIVCGTCEMRKAA